MLYTDKWLPTVMSWQALKVHHNQRCRRPHLQASMSVVAATVAGRRCKECDTAPWHC